MSAPSPAPVCVVVPTWNGWTMLEQCLVGLAAQITPPAQVVVVDNGSTDGTAANVRARWPEVEVLELPENEGFAGGCNRGIEAARPGLDVILLNNDAVPHPQWVDTLANAAATAPEDVGVLSAKLLAEDGRIDSTGDFLTTWGMPFQRGHGEPDSGQYDAGTDIFSACGGASLYRRVMLDAVGDFDETFFAYYEDVDLCFRARLAGWRVCLVPAATVVHAGGGTSTRVHGFRRYHATRNLWFLVVKNVPARLLPAFLVRVALVQGWYLLGAIRHRQLGIALRAHRDALGALPRLLRARQRVQQTVSVPTVEVARWFPRRRRDVSASMGRGTMHA